MGIGGKEGVLGNSWVSGLRNGWMGMSLAEIRQLGKGPSHKCAECKEKISQER